MVPSSCLTWNVVTILPPFDLLDKDGEISEPSIDIDHLLSGCKCVQWNVRNIGRIAASYERHCNNKKQSLELEQGPFGESELPQATISQADQRLLSVSCWQLILSNG